MNGGDTVCRGYFSKGIDREENTDFVERNVLLDV